MSFAKARARSCALACRLGTVEELKVRLMPKGPLPFNQAAITRAFKGARVAGVAVARVEVDANGKIVIIVGKPTDSGYEHVLSMNGITVLDGPPAS